MRIHGTTYEPLRPDRNISGPGRGVSVPEGGDSRPADEGRPGVSAPTTPSDSVSFSDIGRRLSATQADTLDPDRVKELRDRVMSGAYNSLEMVDQVARRILSSGDV